MIVLFKRLSVCTKSLVAWTSHKNKRINWVPDKKESQPFDLLVDKANNLKISGMGNILSFFCEDDEQDLLYWLSGLQQPLNYLQTKVVVNRANKQKNEETLSNLIIVNLLDGTEALSQLNFDKQIYIDMNLKVEKSINGLKKKMERVKPVKDTKKKGTRTPFKPRKKLEKNIPKPTKSKNQIDPVYLEKLNSLNLERWNKDMKLDTSSEKRNILITSALPYVNNEPHLGNLIGAVLSADVFARYCRLSDYNAIYICGTDEYGTATEIKALQEKTTPKEICEKYHHIHADIYKKVSIDFDYFGRTSTQKHEEIVQDMYINCNEQGYIFENTVQQTYCGSCDRFLADRYITAKCPHCNEDAKGDQCDSCGKTLEVGDLVDARCVICKDSVEERDSKHLFLDLIKVKSDLEVFVEESKSRGFWTNNSISITADWLKKARPRCITRDLSWGVPIPREGFEKKCFYVWFDAPIGYISITANYTENWRQWWLSNSEENKEKNPVELYQFMGKDNVPFHTIFFPGSQLASKKPWTYLKHINTTEYLNYESAKFSKSNSTGVFGSHIQETGIPVEVWRYYLLSVRPEGSDTQFQWDDFQDRNNSELLANLGNFCNRVLKFVYSKNDQTIPMIDAQKLDKQDIEFLTQIWEETQNYLNLFENVKIRAATRSAMKVSSLGNGFAQQVQVWTMKEDLELRNNKLAVLITVIRLLGALWEPIMPTFSAKLYFFLNLNRDQEQQGLFAKLRKGENWEVLKTLNLEGNFNGKMNLPVPIFQKSKDYYSILFGFRKKTIIFLAFIYLIYSRKRRH